jgi:hypothetical protein
MPRTPALLLSAITLAACGVEAPSAPLAPKAAPSLAGGPSGGPTNAQSIMVSLDPMGPFVIQGTEIYQFNHDAAEAFFSNTVATGPVITCGGSATNCAVGNQPATPSAPAPDAQKVVPVASTNSCTFFAGGALGVSAPQSSYVQSVTLPGNNTKGSWKFEWTYSVATAATVAEKTAWDLQSSTVTDAQATISGFVAGQSTQSRSSGAWTLKASHTLADALSANGTRVSGLTATLTAPDLTTTAFPLSVSLGASDFVYKSNAGTFGPTNQLFENGYVSAIHQGLVASGIGSDNFAGNNGILVAETAVIAPQLFTMGVAGNYGLTISGTVKGNEGSVAQAFSVSSSISVQAGSCTPVAP